MDVKCENKILGYLSKELANLTLHSDRIRQTRSENIGAIYCKYIPDSSCIQRTVIG